MVELNNTILAMYEENDDVDVDRDTYSLQQSLQMGDLVLKLRDGQEIKVFKAFLIFASPVIESALRCQSGANGLGRSKQQEKCQQGTGFGGRETENARRALPNLKVEGSYEEWTELITFLTHAALTGDQPQLSAASALKIFPIAHMYNMKGLLRACVKKVQQSNPSTLSFHTSTPPHPAPPTPRSPPLGSSDTSNDQASQQLPSIFQWLSAADAKQYPPLVEACLEQLSQQDSVPLVRSALSDCHSRYHLDQLRSGTLMRLLNLGAGLPCNFQGTRVPDLTNAQPVFTKEDSRDSSYLTCGGCLQGPFLVWGRYNLLNDTADSIDTVEVTNLEDGGTTYDLGIEPTDVITSIAACSGTDCLALVCILHGTVKLWDLSSRQCSSVVTGCDGDFQVLCPCGPARFASAAFEEKYVQVWDLATGTIALKTLKGHTDVLHAIDASADGHLLLSGSGDNTCRLWDVRQDRCVRTMQGHNSPVRSVSMDAQGKSGVSGDGKHILTWDLGSGRSMATLTASVEQGIEDLTHPLKRKVRAVNGVRGADMQVQMDAAGTTVLSRGDDGAVHVWDVSRNILTAKHSWPDRLANCMTASRDLSRVAVLFGTAGSARLTVWS